jgi:hypothetical protein
LAYKEKIFSHISNKKSIINTYVAKCHINFKKYLTSLGNSKINLKEANGHLKKVSFTYQRGTIFHSDLNLSSRKYFKIDPLKMKTRYPRNWPNWIRNQKCSTR